MKDCYKDKRLALITNAQSARADRLGAKPLGLSITGVLKAISRTHAFLIQRDGRVTLNVLRRGKC